MKEFADIDFWVIGYGFLMYGIGRIAQYLEDRRKVKRGEFK